jgi:hypothetical protein
MTAVRRITLAMLAIVVASCSAADTGSTGTSAPPDTTTSTVASSTSQPEAPQLPPYERDDIAALFDPIVEPLGYRVTRASLFDRAELTVSPEGNHLAIYVAPLEDFDIERIASDFAPLVSLFLPVVFDTYPGLEWFDICQEPFGATEAIPPSQTRIEVSRAAIEALDWTDLDLAKMLSYRDADGVMIFGRLGTISTTTAWQEAMAGSRGGGDG